MNSDSSHSSTSQALVSPPPNLMGEVANHQATTAQPLEASTSTDDVKELYTPLSKYGIRYLFLLPGNFEDPIKCSLLNSSQARTKISDVGDQYEALSYEWCAPLPEHRLELNGHEVKV